MTEPKRHHWWPEVQSKQWAGIDGMLHVVRADGTVFKVPPSKVGVEGELYTRVDPSGRKDREIERWFSRDVETPFADSFSRILALDNIRRTRFPNRGDPAKRKQVQELGFLVSDFDEGLRLSGPSRAAVANYVAALVVRSPAYLSKLTICHQKNNPSKRMPKDRVSYRDFALENMLFLYDIYREAIARASINLMIAECDHEFLFSDGGVVAKEPWSAGHLPFDLYVPLTPKLALNVLPIPGSDISELWISRINSRGVARYNRNILANATRFVFSRSPPPLAFIKRHFGVPAPKPFGHRWVNGRLETIYDRDRDIPM